MSFPDCSDTNLNVYISNSLTKYVIKLSVRFIDLFHLRLLTLECEILPLRLRFSFFWVGMLLLSGPKVVWVESRHTIVPKGIDAEWLFPIFLWMSLALRL